jgi:hypothetical protein
VSMRRFGVTIIVLAALIAAGCTSPEARRTRGGGSGGDVANRPEQVRMHEGSQPYYGTPVLIFGEGPPLAPSEQARRLSLERSDQGSTDGGVPKP